MKKIKGKKKEEIAEDYCFLCKDGGLLLVCDYKDCLKAYHPECVGKDGSFVESGKRWTCNWHSCVICGRASSFHCFCCPSGMCKRCINASVEFARVRGNKGFCKHCLKLALLIEEDADADSDGGKVDFKDRETLEFLFMEYWKIIKDQERLTLEDIYSADAILKRGGTKKEKPNSDLDEVGEESEESEESEKEELEEIVSDYDSMDDMDNYKRGSKRKKSNKKGKQGVVKKKVTSKKKEFIGWGSRSLVEFLASIGKDTIKQLSQFDVSSIIDEYIVENKLFHPEKKKKVICDERLQTFLRRKSVSKYKIYNLLETHLAENMEESENDEAEPSSEDNVNNNTIVACKRQKKTSVDRKTQIDEGVIDMQRGGKNKRKWGPDGKSHVDEVVLDMKSCFASIVAKNIKLTYLRRSLVDELLKQPKTFESKILGSFVRVKCDPDDYLQKNSHQLLQVTGIKKTSKDGEINSVILLQVSNMPKDIPISMLSDNDFSEEECEDLHQKMKDGLLKKPTVAQLEEKARSLHEDITKHWFVRELDLLQKLIDRANEKGRRGELFEYMERKTLLQTSTEQTRLLQELPKVIAEVVNVEPAHENQPEDDEQGDDSLPNGNEGYGNMVNENPAYRILRSHTAGSRDEHGETINKEAAGNIVEGSNIILFLYFVH